MNRAHATGLRRDMLPHLAPSDEDIMHGLTGSQLRQAARHLVQTLAEPHEHDLHRLADDGGPAE